MSYLLSTMMRILALFLLLCAHLAEQADSNFTVSPNVSHMESRLQDLENTVATLRYKLANVQRTTSSAEQADSNFTVSPNVSQMESRLQDLENTVATLRYKLANVQRTTSSGPMYIRWGRKTCPENGTEMLYSGYVGGSHHSHYGGAANRLCMTSTPTLDENLGRGGGAYLYGAEYNTNFNNKATVNYDVPCAVCRVTTRASAVMIPGVNKCYSGWTLEYKGVLTAGNYGHEAASEYLCLDTDAENVFHSYEKDEGSVFTFVQAVCTSLPCPPYKPSRRIPCAVCTF